METKPVRKRPPIPSDTPSFGIEFEFLIAFLKNPETPNPNPSDPRTVYFPSAAEDDLPSFQVPPGKEDWASEWSIYAHIKRTLSSIGLPTERGKAHSNFAMWEVTTDGSICRPKPPSRKNKKAYDDWRTYMYYPIEVRTPAYYYSEDALTDVADFCKIMRKNYLITVNATCGLHVHIGYGLSGFELPHLRRLGALIEAFEPQLDSIHPAHRIDGHNTHCTSFRRGTYYQWKFRQEQRREPRVLEAIGTVLTCHTRDQFRAFVASEGPKGTVGFEDCTSSWNFNRMGTETRPKVDWVQDTIEFRGHEGTLDPEAVVNWTRLLVGLVKYTREPNMFDFGNLLQRVTGEKWVKEILDAKATGGRYGLGRGMYRPIFGEKWCGLVDFLRLLGLEGPASHYENRKGKYLENGLYTHWYSSAPAEYTVLADGDDGGGDSDKNDSEDSKTSDDSPPSDSSSGGSRPFNPNPGTPPGAPPGVPPRSPPGDKPGDEEGDEAQGQSQGQDKDGDEDKGQGQDKDEGQGQDEDKGQGQDEDEDEHKGQGQDKDEDEEAPSETESAPSSSEEEEFPARPDAKKLQEVGGANNPPSRSTSSKDAGSSEVSGSSEFSNPTPPDVPGDSEAVPVESYVPSLPPVPPAPTLPSLPPAPTLPEFDLPPTLPPVPKDSLPASTFPVPTTLPPAPKHPLPAPTPSGKGVPSPSSSPPVKPNVSNPKSNPSSTDSSKQPDKTKSEYETEASAAKKVLQKFWEEEAKRPKDDDEEKKEKERQRSSMDLGSMGGGSERSVGSGSLVFEDAGPRDEEGEDMLPWEGIGVEDAEEEVKVKEEKDEKERKKKEKKKKEKERKKEKEEKEKKEKEKEKKEKESEKEEEKDTDGDPDTDDSILERPREQDGVENPASEEEDGLEYLIATGLQKLPPLPGHINYSFRTAKQHSHLLNGTNPKEIRALAPNTGNAIGSRFHRRDREPSSPWFREAPNIACMDPSRMPYPGPDPWFGTPNYPLFQARAQLADALYEEEVDDENDDGIWRAKGTMGETWDIQHGEPATRSEKLRRMLKGLRVHDMSPSIEGYLRYKAERQGREDFWKNPDHLFPPAAATLEEFEKNDDEWWRFEVACTTVDDLIAQSEDADDEISNDACEAIRRIGGAGGNGVGYWPEGAQNPFGTQPRTQEPVQEDVSPHADVPGIHFPFPGQSQADFQKGLEVLKEAEEEKRRQKAEKDRIGKMLREQNQKIMDEMRREEEEMEKRRQKMLPPPLPPRSNLRPPPLPPR